MQEKVLCLMADGVEEMELVAPLDVLRRAGLRVDLIALQENSLVTSRGGMRFYSEKSLSEVNLNDYAMLLLPGGPAVTALRQQGVAAQCARDFAAEGKWVAAICAAPLLLSDAGLLAGRRYTAHDSVWTDLTAALGNEAVVVDGKIITSRAAGTALEFGLMLVQVLCGMTVRQRVEREIMY